LPGGVNAGLNNRDFWFNAGRRRGGSPPRRSPAEHFAARARLGFIRFFEETFLHFF